MSAQRQAFEAWASDNGEFPKTVARSGDDYRLMITQTQWVAWQAALSQQAPVSAEASIWTDEIITKIYVDAIGYELKHSRARLWDLFSAIESHVRLAIAQSRAQVVPAEPVALSSLRGMLAGNAAARSSEQIVEASRYDAAPAVSEPSADTLMKIAQAASLFPAAPSAPIEPKCPICRGTGRYGTPGKHCEWCDGKGVKNWSAPIEPTPPSDQDLVDTAWRLWHLRPADAAWRALPDYKRIEIAFRDAYAEGFAAAAPAEPTPIASINMEQAFERHFGISMQRARNSFEQAGVAKYWEAGWDARGDAASEAEALRADAERYRWMRDKSRPLNDLLENLYRDQLDAFVDSAIAASKPASAKGGEAS